MSTSMELELDGTGPLYRQLYGALRTAILSGALSADEQLPSTRALAAAVKVSRITVVLAYEQLLAEGYAAARRGSGTYVTAGLGAGRGADRRRGRGTPPAPRWSRFGRRIVAAAKLQPPSWAPRPPPLPYDFRY